MNMQKKRGAPVRMEGGRRIELYLDEQTIAVIRKAGGGNASEGVRLLATKHRTNDVLLNSTDDTN